MGNPIIKYFEYTLLLKKLQAASKPKPLGDLAKQMNEQLSNVAKKA